MTKRLEQLFEMDDSDDSENQTDAQDLTTPVLPTVDFEQTKQSALSNLEKIESALEEVKGLVESDKELDDIAAQAKEGFDNLMDLGMQVDSRFSSEIFSVAGTMLGHALSAKTAKINKKLKMIDLQLKKAELDRKNLAAQQNNPSQPGTPTDLGTGVVIDRNELIKQILSQGTASNPDKKDK